MAKSLSKIRIREVREMFNYCKQFRVYTDGCSRTLLATSAIASVLFTGRVGSQVCLSHNAPVLRTRVTNFIMLLRFFFLKTLFLMVIPLKSCRTPVGITLAYKRHKTRVQTSSTKKKNNKNI